MDIVEAPARMLTSGHGTSGVIAPAAPLAVVVVTVDDENNEENEFAGV